MTHNQRPTPSGIESGFLAPQVGEEVANQNFEYDKPQDECGVIAVYAAGEPVCQIAYQGMKALQHRGQSGAGIAYFDNDSHGIPGRQAMIAHKGAGLIPEAISAEVFPRPGGRSRIDETSRSHVAIGHTRYSTSESNNLSAMHPFLGEQTGMALAHNGHVELLDDLAQTYGVDAAKLPSDSALLAAIIDSAAARHDGNITDALKEVLPHVNGAYNLVIATKQGIHAARDPWGFHPLTLGRLTNGGGYVVASEAVAYKTMDAEFIRDIEAGEILRIDDSGLHSEHIDRQEDEKNCLFEFIYTARVDGIVNGVSVYRARKYFGEFLAYDTAVDADVVVGVPGSGLTAASGYSEASGLPRVDGILKDPYIGRTFIERGSSRQNSLLEKFQLIPEELEGRRVVLVDDSIIKSNTMRQLVKMVRGAGAVEVHVRSSAPHYLYPCYMGMDTTDVSKLVARHMTDAEICQSIGANSIGFNRPERMAEAIALAQINRTAASMGNKLCMACVTGEYPMPVPAASNLLIDLPLPRRRTIVNLGQHALSPASAS